MHIQSSQPSPGLLDLGLAGILVAAEARQSSNPWPPGLGTSRTKLRREQRKRQLEKLRRIALELRGSTADRVNSSGVHGTEKHDNDMEKGILVAAEPRQSQDKSTQTSALEVRKVAELTLK